MVAAPGCSGLSGPRRTINNRCGKNVASRFSGDPQTVLSMWARLPGGFRAGRGNGLQTHTGTSIIQKQNSRLLQGLLYL